MAALAKASRPKQVQGRRWYLKLRGTLEGLHSFVEDMKPCLVGAVAFSEFDTDEIEYKIRLFLQTNKQLVQTSVLRKSFVFLKKRFASIARFTNEDLFHSKIKLIKKASSSSVDIFTFGEFMKRGELTSRNLNAAYKKKRLQERFGCVPKSWFNLKNLNTDFLKVEDDRAACPEEPGNRLEVERSKIVPESDIEKKTAKIVSVDIPEPDNDFEDAYSMIEAIHQEEEEVNSVIENNLNPEEGEISMIEFFDPETPELEVDKMFKQFSFFHKVDLKEKKCAE